jgi:hypothetical protein
MKDTLYSSSTLTLLMEFWPSGLRQTGTEPVSVLTLLADCGFQLYLIDGGRRLQRLLDYEEVVGSLPDRRYVNLVALKGSRSSDLANAA